MNKLLIANRGEIACRIIRTAKQQGIATVAVYSTVDAQAQHVLNADQAVCIGPAMAAESYLVVDNIIAAAQQTGADAIHPGYGFLSENPALVDACTQHGITFVGPSASAMRAMGLKDAAKQLMSEAGVPVVPGYHGESQMPELLAAQAVKIGYPVLIKARAGGGGKGMRQVHHPGEFAAALEAAQREADASFGDPHVLIEKYIAKPRHIEVQVFGDSHGNVVHLFERDCSLQRRHQKVIEEAPAPDMPSAVRQAMTSAALTAAKAIAYEGAGTVEFIVDGSSELRTDGFWFMEMNTRLQVEHPVTEAITGIDLVDWQLRVARGEPLPKVQSDIHMDGHAVEARLYAENPSNGFLPAVGYLARFSLSALGRADSGVVAGDRVLPHYDPLLAKLVAHAPDRPSAFVRLARQLEESCVMGTITNREFLWRLAKHDAVVAGRFDTSFIAVHFDQLVATPCLPALAAAACIALVEPWLDDQPVAPVANRLGSWQLWGAAKRQVRLLHEGEILLFDCVQVHQAPMGQYWQVSCPGWSAFPSSGFQLCRQHVHKLRVNGVVQPFYSVLDDHEMSVQLGPEAAVFSLPVPGADPSLEHSSDTILSPMPGRVVAVHCSVGERIKSGQALVSVEAMKMEQDLTSPRDGVVEFIGVGVGDQITEEVELVRLVEE